MNKHRILEEVKSILAARFPLIDLEPDSQTEGLGGAGGKVGCGAPGTVNVSVYHVNTQALLTGR